MELKFRGIKESYPNIKFRKIAYYIQLVRPFTLLAPVFAGMMGVLASAGKITADCFLTAIYVGLVLAILQASGQVMNQYADAELDKIVKPYRPIPKGLISREEALSFSLALAATGVFGAFSISLPFGLISLLILFFAMFYSLPPFSPRRVHPMAGVLWLAVSRGLIPVIAVWIIYGDILDSIPYGLIAFTWVLGFQSTKDVPDVEGDRMFGIKTVPSVYGKKGLLALMLASLTALVSFSVAFKIYLMLLLAPLAAAAILGHSKQSKYSENTVSWVCYYSGLAFFYVLLFFNEALA